VAPPPGRRAIRPVLRPGDLLTSRYRLECPVEAAPRATEDEESPAVVWRARDEVLARPVAVKVLRAAGRRGAAEARPFLQAAAAAGGLSSPVLARVYDAAIEQRPAERAGRPAGEVDVAYVISEWVEGRDLAAALREDGPFEPDVASALVQQVAEALQSAHTRGVWHGRVHPGNVLLTPPGRLKLTDTATSAALPGRAAPAQRADDPVGAAADVRDLTAVLYAMLTARWPTSATPQPACGLRPAPAVSDGRSRGRLTSPRQVRAGVPRALDELVVRGLQPTAVRPGPATAAALADALGSAVRADAPRPVVPREPRIPPRLRRRLPLLASLALLTVVGVSAYSIGRDVGTIAPVDDPLERIASTAPGQPSGGDLIDLATVRVTDFDPLGEGKERTGSVPNAYDDDPTTVWETERYRSAAFGGLKEGVGLLVDFGAPTRVSRVELVTTGGGVTLELRTADEAPAQPEDLRVVASGTARDPGLVLTPPGGTAARWYLLWVTGLREVDGGFSAGIAEMRFLRG
jgi:serine/threonine protein kinase